MTERHGGTARHTARLPLLVVFAACAGCLIGHPILDGIEEMDLPPVVLSVSPSNDEPVRVDQSQALPVTFSLLEIVDQNLDDQIKYVIEQLVVDQEQTRRLVLEEGVLMPSSVQDRDDVTVYDPVTRTVDPCDAQLRQLTTDAALEIRIRLTDRIPDSQVDRVGQEDHIVEVGWLVALPGDCPPLEEL